MEIKEWKSLQEEAYKVFTKVYSLNWENEQEVFAFMSEIHPYMINANIRMPKEQLFSWLERYGYGTESLNQNPICKQISNIMIDIEIEEFANINNNIRSRQEENLIH